MSKMSLDSSTGPYIQLCLYKEFCHYWLKAERIAAEVYTFFLRVGMVCCADTFVGWDMEFMAESGVLRVEVDSKISVCGILQLTMGEVEVVQSHRRVVADANV